MSEDTNVANLTFELLKRMSARFDRFEIELLDVKMRLSSIDEHMAGLVTSVAGINSRIDRLKSASAASSGVSIWWTSADA